MGRRGKSYALVRTFHSGMQILRYWGPKRNRSTPQVTVETPRRTVFDSPTGRSRRI